MEHDSTAAELRRIESQIAIGVAGNGAQLLRVLGDGLVVDLVPTAEDEEPLHWWRWRRLAS